MEWKTWLASITGSVDQELLLRNEYLVAEHRVLRKQIPRRVRLTDGERQTLADLGKRLGKKALNDVATIVKPDTLLAWHRKRAMQKFDGSPHRQCPGRLRVDQGLAVVVVRMAQENRSWGYDRMVGALANRGYTVSDQTVGNILKRHGIPPALERKKTTSWNEFMRAHMDVLVATDFFTTEGWTWRGLVTYDVLCFLRMRTRTVQVAGSTSHPSQAGMTHMARKVTMADWGLLTPGQYVIYDRDRKFCPAFQQTMDGVGVKRIVLPPRSPNVNAHAERWVRAVKDEVFGRLILFGEGALRHALKADEIHSHHERNHQGKGNRLLMPLAREAVRGAGPIHSRERLGGLLKYYSREAA